jgi:hypothetical protein
MKKLLFGLVGASLLAAGSMAAMTAPAEARSRNNTSFSVTLGNAQFGYSDGYYDSDRRWHRWNNNRQRSWYQRNHRSSYYHMRRHRDRDQYRRDWRDGRRDNWRGDNH